jgi:hypothetical protein
MPQHPPALPPDIPGTEADDLAYVAQCATVPLLRARYPLYFLLSGLAMALTSIVAGIALSIGADDLPEDARRERYAHAVSICSMGFAVATTLIGIGSTALQSSNGTSDTPRPLHRPYPAPSPQYPPQEMAGAPPDVGLWEDRGRSPEPPEGRPMGFHLPVEEIVDIRFDRIGQRQAMDIFEFEDPECFGAELS